MGDMPKHMRDELQSEEEWLESWGLRRNVNGDIEDANDPYDLETPLEIQVLSDQLTKAEQEITKLRELINSLRGLTEAMPCACAEQTEGVICKRCWIIGHIDKGLAEIPNEPDKRPGIEGY